MIRKSLLTILLILLPYFCFAESPVLWQGGLWNLDYPGDVSTYGYFRLLLEPDVLQKEARVLRVEWVEKLDSKGERVYASRLIPELGTFLGSGKITVEMGEAPSAIRLQDSKGRVLWLRLWEPTRFSIQESLKYERSDTSVTK
jgi:hypothetical protein